MANVAISGDTSGAVTLTVPSTVGTQTATFPAATGTVMVSGNMPAFGSYQNNNTTSISSGTWTLTPNNTKVFDTNNCYNNTGSTVTLNSLSVPAYAFCPNVAGYYQVNGSSAVYSATSNKSFCSIYKNGTATATGAFGQFTATVSETINTVSFILYLNGTGDYIQLYTWQGTGSTLSIDYGISSDWFNAAMVRNA